MRMRADQLLVSRGLFESRARAQAAIEAGLVFAGGEAVKKASQMLEAGAAIEAKAAYPHVSRAGVKLEAALKHFGVDPKGRICLDIGASTGGFTDVLLRAGAAKIYAVDVGTAQLHPSLKDRPEIVSLENTDLRSLKAEQFSGLPDLVVIDVSFISLKLILPKAGELAAGRAEMLVLIKPQFEAGRKSLKKGIVRDAAVRDAVCGEIATFATGLGWNVLGVMESPIAGGDGNREFLLGARRGGSPRR